MANQPKKYKKFVATAATATLVAAAIVPVASAAGFTDVENNTHKDAINALSDAGIINGYADGTFKPNQTINRGQVVKLLGRWLETEGFEVPSDWETSQRFKDLPLTAEKELVKYAALAKDAGVFAGSNGNLNHTQTMQRQQMAVVLVRAIKEIAGVDLVADYKKAGFVTEISDLEKAYSAEQRSAIVALEYAGITNVSNFNPGNSVTRGQFASFLYRTIENVINAPVAGVKEIKAVNNTTVEVTFDEEVDNVQALHFLISDLEVKSAAVKQTNKKVVVLTTAAQTADKEYTVSLGEDKIGTFKGIAAVVPTAIKLTTPSVQGTIGKEVTLKAEVTVPEGQSKEGIPVTFNIANSTNNQLNEKIEKVAYTNADGVATYSYTRYYKHNDNVTAYATDKSSVYASGKVYWAEGITITEATTGNELANGSKKVYKIKTDAYNTQYVGTSNVVDYNYVNVAFAENVDVSPDKLVRDVKVIDTGVVGNADYPSQVTTGGVNVVKVKVNSNGEATFTLTGSNASVTPIVFVDESTNKVGKYTNTALQASAPTVKFALNHTLGLTVKAEGVQNAAATNINNYLNKGTGEGGREYTVTVTDKDGKVAPAGTKAYVTFADGSYSTDKTVTILSADGKRNAVANKNARFEIEVTGSKGEAKFKLIGARDAFAAPTVYLENGKEVGLDKADLQTVGETTYFVDAVIANATLTVVNSNGKEVTTLPTTQTAYFEYQSVDQNGFDYYAGTGVYEVSYQVTAQFADVTVSGSGLPLKTVKAGTTETVKVNSASGKAVLNVNSTNVASNVSVQASASQVSLPNQTASLAFTKGSQVPDVYTGNVSAIDTVNNKLTFVNYDAITYSTSSFKNEAGVVISEAHFEKLVSDALAAKYPVTVTSTKNTDGTYSLEIEKIDTTPGTIAAGKVTKAVLSEAGTELTLTFDKNVVTSSVTDADFTLSPGTVASVASVNGTTVVLNVTGTSSAATLTVVADGITFTDGTSNAVQSGIVITQPLVTKVIALTQTTASLKAATEVLANGKVEVGSNALEIKGITTKPQAPLNGVKVIVKQGLDADVVVSYNPSNTTITVELGYTDTNNTDSNIKTKINALGVHGSINFADVDVTTATLTWADVINPQTITLAEGVTGVATAVPGVYSFELKAIPAVGDSITINGKTYVAGTNFTVASTLATTTANLVDAIKATDSRFDSTSTTNAAGVVTLTEATATGLAAPSFSYSFK